MVSLCPRPLCLASVACRCQERDLSLRPQSTTGSTVLPLLREATGPARPELQLLGCMLFPPAGTRNTGPCLKTPCAFQTQSVGRVCLLPQALWDPTPAQPPPLPGQALALGGSGVCLLPSVLPGFPTGPGQSESPDMALGRSSVASLFYILSPSSARSTPLCSFLLFSILFLASPTGCRHSFLASLSACLPLSILQMPTPSGAILVSSFCPSPLGHSISLGQLFGGLACHSYTCWVHSAHLEKPEAIEWASPRGWLKK